MNPEDLVGPAATLTAALLNPINQAATRQPGQDLDGRAAYQGAAPAIVSARRAPWGQSFFDQLPPSVRLTARPVVLPTRAMLTTPNGCSEHREFD
jgi:hypothetical protein